MKNCGSRRNSRGNIVTLIAIALTAMTLFVANASIAAQETVIYSFNSSTDGFLPQGVLTRDANGNLYGTTTYQNGTVYGGTVFELSPVAGGGWTEQILWSFGQTATDGTRPFAGVIMDANGNLYGTTNAGGANNYGTVFELSPVVGGGWTEKVLWSFNNDGTDGYYPQSDLVMDASGNLIGTARDGGVNRYGVVFELTPQANGSWTETLLHSFGATNDGAGSAGGLIADKAGNLYGLTTSGGAAGDGGAGTVYELSPGSGGSWNYAILYSFDANNSDAGDNLGRLAFDAAGNLYGSSFSGGTDFEGAIFELSPSASGWTEKVLHSFSITGTTDGYDAWAGPVLNAAGTLFCGTIHGGSNSDGTVIQLVPQSDGTLKEGILHDFGGLTDGGTPYGALMIDPDGNLFGTTTDGGANGKGEIFEIASTTVATPVFSPAAGTYSSAQTVTITDSTPSSTIYYTTDGTPPTTASTQYISAITVSATETINAIAVATGDSQSAVATAIYTIQNPTATPAFSVATGTYATAQTVAISDATAGATIYYTTNGATPTTSSTKYTAPITVSSTETISAIAVASGYTQSAEAAATYTLENPAATPVFSVAPGTYAAAQTVSISDATTAATIYYTTDGSLPTTSSTKYTAAIIVSATETINAIATATGYTESAIATAVYTINLPAAATPIFSVAAGTYTSVQTVLLTDATTAATIYYTTDGSLPTTSSIKYTGAIAVSATETINAIATAAGYTESAVATAAYTINLPATATPVFSVAAGTYTAAQSITISDATAGATIYYTTNGSTPTTSSTQYTGAITVGSSETLEAIATASGDTPSAVASAAYTVNIPPPTAATPTFSPAAGTYTSVQNVTISDATASAAIYYTTDGSTPTTSSTTYTGPITVGSSQTLTAIATASGYTSSLVATAAYVINLPAPDFSVSVSPTTVSVESGQSGTAAVSITPLNGFDAAVSFSCSGLPTGDTCAFLPASVTPAGAAVSTTLTVSTTTTNSSLDQKSRPFFPRKIPGTIPGKFPATALAAALCCIGLRKRRRLQMLLMVAVAVLGMSLLNGCGGGSKSTTSTITVTATSGALQHATTFSLTVK